MSWLSFRDFLALSSVVEYRHHLDFGSGSLAVFPTARFTCTVCGIASKNCQGCLEAALLLSMMSIVSGYSTESINESYQA